MLRKIIYLISIFYVWGCTTNPIPLPKQAINQIQSSEILLFKNQDGLIAELKDTSGEAVMVGGIIGAIIDASFIDSKFIKEGSLITPIRNSISDYNFEEKLTTRLNTQIREISWLNASKVESVSSDPKTILKDRINAKQSDVVGVLKPFYTLSPDYSRLKIKLEVSLYPASPKLKEMTSNFDSEQSEPLYRTEFMRLISHPNLSLKKKTNGTNWALDNGKLIRNSLDKGIEEIAQEFFAQLSNLNLKKLE